VRLSWPDAPFDVLSSEKVTARKGKIFDHAGGADGPRKKGETLAEIGPAEQDASPSSGRPK
jgi:hypothetical protein